MNDKINIAVLVGTIRERRESIKAAHWVADFGRQQPDVEIIFVDPGEFNFPHDGNDPEGKDPRYTEIIKRADALFIVTPEYNHGYPSSLKRMLDSEYALYRHKPVALAGASNGPWGGVRVCEALLPVCHRLGLVNIQPELYFPFVQNIFDDNGQMKPEYVERYENNIQKVYDELLLLARTLKRMREENS